MNIVEHVSLLHAQHAEECKSIHSFLLCTKLKSEWIKDLYIKAVTLKAIEKKVGKSLEHMSTGEIFLNRTPMAYELRS